MCERVIQNSPSSPLEKGVWEGSHASAIHKQGGGETREIAVVKGRVDLHACSLPDAAAATGSWEEEEGGRRMVQAGEELKRKEEFAQA